MTIITNFNTCTGKKFCTAGKWRERGKNKYQETWFVSTPLIADDQITMSDTWRAVQISPHNLNNPKMNMA
jgi:hypothetical protein